MRVIGLVDAIVTAVVILLQFLFPGFLDFLFTFCLLILK